MTMRQTRRVFFATCLGALAFGASVASAQETIKIGAVYASTGNAAYFSRQVVQGVRVAIDEVNSAGGLLGGRKIELLLEDDEGRPDVSATKFRKLIDGGAVALLSLSGAASSLQNHRVAQEGKTPSLSVNIADPLFQLQNPYLFLTSMPAQVQVDAIIAYLRKNKMSKVALVTDTGAVGASVGRSIREGLTKGGVNIVTEQTLERGATDFIPQWQRIRDAGAEIVVDAAQSPAEQILFRRTYKRLGLTLPTLGTTGWGFPVFAQQLGDQVDGIIYVDMLDVEKPEFLAYKDAYAKHHKDEPDLTNASGYDTMGVLIDAIKRAGKADREAIRTALQATANYKAVLGAKDTTFNFAPDRRWAFPPNGAVIRVYESAKRGKVIFRGNN